MKSPESSLSVLLTTAYPRTAHYLSEFQQLCMKDRMKLHTLTCDPEQADIILFLNDFHADHDPLHADLRQHPLVRRFREKVFAYFEEDQPWCVLPGLYCSMPRGNFRMDRQRACTYLRTINPYIEHGGKTYPQPDLLFSFMGGRTHPVRARLLSLNHPHGHLEDTSGSFHAFGQNRSEGADKQIMQMRYSEVIARSRFVLCPRGFGTSSYRLFEALQAGRVPVILSDEWMPPLGPDWESFSIRVPESQAEDVPSILEREQGSWEYRARQARRAWVEWFAPEVRFHRMIESCAQIYSTRRRSERIAQGVVEIQAMQKRLYMAAKPFVDKIRN